MMTRSLRFVTVLMVSAIISGCGSSEDHAKNVLRVGYQKWGTLSILKESGELSSHFKSKGIEIEWIEFPAGPPLLEALNAGSVDVGHAGDSPPLFAQAAGIPFLYLAASPASPDNSAILVQKNSAIKQAQDLEGRKVGFTKGTSAHTFVLRFLENNGLSLSDITPMYLAPADGRVALESGSIDAWAIWDPYLAAAEDGGHVRKLASGNGYVEGREFYFASRQVAERDPELLKDFLNELKRVKPWADEHADQVNAFLARETGLSLEAIQLAETRQIRYDTEPITPQLIAYQQALADRYFELQLLPRRIDVSEVIWQGLLSQPEIATHP